MTLLSTSFRKQAAEQFQTSFESNFYYVTIGGAIPYDNESQVTETQTSLVDENRTRKNILFGKYVPETDVSFVISNIPWQINTIYDMYDSTTVDLSTKSFYVVVNEPGNFYSVFKCMDNNNGARTRTAPKYSETNPVERLYKTSDGYQWKYMFRITDAEYAKFSSSKYVTLKRDQEVIDAAVPGAIDVIKVSSGGSKYNSYAYGNIRQAQITGDPLIHSLQTNDAYDIMTFTIDSLVGTINTGRRVYFKNTANTVWNATLPPYGDVYSYDDAYLKLLMRTNLTFPLNIDKLFQTTNNTSNGTVSFSSSILEYRRDRTPVLSANTDFYKGCSFYLRSGLGAGQLKTIREYSVSGNDRKVVLDSAFTTVPDSTSKFEILPKILISGDGSSSNGSGSATAIPVIDDSSNTIIQIEVIDSGKNYTYATATISANTGFISNGVVEVANSAVIVPIISPLGGHGSNPEEEFHANTICVASTYDSTESNRVPVTDKFRTITLLKNPLSRELELDIDISALLFDDEEKVVQLETGASGFVQNRVGSVLTLTNVSGFFSTVYDIQTVRGSGEVVAEVTAVSKDLRLIDNRVILATQILSLGSDFSGITQGDFIYQGPAEMPTASGYVYTVSNTSISVASSSGVWAISDDPNGIVEQVLSSRNLASSKVTGVLESDFLKDSGTVLYIKDVLSVQRNVSQKEKLKLFITF